MSGRPTNLNQFTNGPGYITSSGSCSYATSAGTAKGLFFQGDGSLKLYSRSGGSCPGCGTEEVCLQTSIDDTDGQTHSHPTNYGDRCGLALQPRGGYVTVGGRRIGGGFWNVIPAIGSDGVMEVGKYIDFHNSSGDSSDYCFRLEANSGSLTGSGNFYSNSDRRLKKNIQEIDRQCLGNLFNDSDKLLKKFTWKLSGKDSYGFIAQQLEEYIPEAVLTSVEGTKSVDYNAAYAKLFASLINEIKTLKNQVQTLLADK